MDRTLDYASWWVLCYLCSIPHEIAHGTVALRCGDSTALRAGRLSWDPRAHFDIWWTVLIPIIMLSTTGMCLWGPKPVPVNPYYLKNIKRDSMLVSLAGPLTNLAIALGFFLLASIPGFADKDSWNELIFGKIVMVNLVIFCFNLLPIPPLDGFGILEGFLPRALEDVAGFIRTGGVMVLLIAMSMGVVNVVVGPMLEWTLGVLAYVNLDLVLEIVRQLNAR
ncbi:MAG: site-2 protease family protein [Planctomycetota bacterium]